MWESTVDGRLLNFHLAGINNQNFIMSDTETGSWWQQVTGQAIQGPFKGQRLKYVSHDELTFGQWQREQAVSRVLRPDDSAPWQKFSENWEEKTARLPTTTETKPGEMLAPRELVIGITLGNNSKAYPVAAIEKQSPILDRIGATPIMVILGDDGKSIRAFERVVQGRPLEFFAKPASSQLRLVDSETGSEWDFTGQAISGPLTGQQLRKVDILKDYWFDWQTYHPETAVYQF